MIDNSLVVFNTSIKINQINYLDRDAVWPSNVEICITRYPVRKRDGFSTDGIASFANKLKSAVTTNGSVFLVCYAPSEAKWRPFEIAKAMVDAGFTHVDNIIIEKTWLPGKRAENVLVNSHDYVLWFCNGNTWKIDRAPLKKYMLIEDSTPCVGNTWLVETGSLDESYSEDLAELLLRMTDCLPGSLVFDPMMGNTGILRSCLKLGHSLVGFESDPRKITQYKKVIKDFESSQKSED